MSWRTDCCCCCCRRRRRRTICRRRFFIDTTTKDLREGDLYLVNDFTAVHRKVRAMAALRGGVILSGGVLEGRPGVKVTFSRGLDLPVAVYVTDEFKREEPGLTLILRHACSNGWQAVGADGLRGRGRKPSLILRGASESAEGLGGFRGVLCFAGSAFVAWLATKSRLNSGTMRVKARVE